MTYDLVVDGQTMIENLTFSEALELLLTLEAEQETMGVGQDQSRDLLAA